MVQASSPSETPGFCYASKAGSDKLPEETPAASDYQSVVPY